jgi:hypothetical protein
MLAMAAAAGARRTGGDPRLADVAAELADFAKRNAAERLLSWGAGLGPRPGARERSQAATGRP